MLIVQGTQDTIVPASQSLELQRALRQYRVPVQYISYQGAHAWQGLTKQQYFTILTQQLAYLSQE